VQPAETSLHPGGVGRDRQKQGQHRPQGVANGDSPISAADSDVHVQAERVVAPRHVLEPFLHSAVVLGVDDALFLPGTPGMRARRPERHALPRHQLEEPVAALLLASDGIGEVPALAGADLDLRGDQLSGH
jgi:hypothetical protein